MRAARFHGPRDIRIEEVPDPVPGPTDVVVAVAANGICGTDLHEYQAGPRFLPVAPHPITGVAVPLVVGHEFAGTVVAVGAEVDPSVVGRNVAVQPMQACERCTECTAGHRHRCRELTIIGITAPGGGMAELAAVHHRQLHALPPELPVGQGPLVEPLAVGYHAARRVAALLPAAGPVVVHGGGPIGVATALGLRVAGLDEVLVVEPAEARGAIVRALGFELLTPSADLPAVLAERTGGRGPAASVVAAGVAPVVELACTTTAPGGVVGLVAAHDGRLEFDPQQIKNDELLLTGSRGYTAADFDAVIEHLAAGRFPIEPFVRRLPMEAIDEGMAELAAGDALKVLLDPCADRSQK